LGLREPADHQAGFPQKQTHQSLCGGNVNNRQDIKSVVAIGKKKGAEATLS
jgi:hypothetical protein